VRDTGVRDGPPRAAAGSAVDVRQAQAIIDSGRQGLQQAHYVNDWDMHCSNYWADTGRFGEAPPAAFHERSGQIAIFHDGNGRVPTTTPPVNPALVERLRPHYEGTAPGGPASGSVRPSESPSSVPADTRPTVREEVRDTDVREGPARAAVGSAVDVRQAQAILDLPAVEQIRMELQQTFDWDAHCANFWYETGRFGETPPPAFHRADGGLAIHSDGYGRVVENPPPVSQALIDRLRPLYEEPPSPSGS
jgi:hypothetical protein